MAQDVATGHYDPMDYDIMCEAGYRVVAVFTKWQSQASTERESRHWHEERVRVLQGMRGVNPRDTQAVLEHTRALRTEFAQLPDDAPSLA